MEGTKVEVVESKLSGIQPFSGTPEEMSPAESMVLTQGKALQRVETQYTTAVAVQKPRSITRLLSNGLEEAQLAAGSFYYGWMAKTKSGPVRIEGPSIDLAMCVARNYGNCALDIEANETRTHFMMKGVFIDLESGFTCPRLFRQRKSQSLGGKMEQDLDRQEDIVFQIGQSKVIRNAIVRAMPKWLIDKAIEVAKQAELQSIRAESPVVAQSKGLSFFKEYGVSQESIESKVGKKADEWSAEDIADLRGNAVAVKEGRIRADELFPSQEVANKLKGKGKPQAKAKEGMYDATAASKAEKKEEEKEKKGEEKEDPIRAAYKKLKKAGFKLYVEGNILAIQQLPQKYQDEIYAKWDKFDYGESFPGSAPVEKVEEIEETEDPGQQTQDEKILRLVTGAEFDQGMGQPIIPCRDKKTKVGANWCLQSCEGKGECKPWEKFNAEEAKE